MVPTTRRRALLGAAGVLAGLAGCAGHTASSGSSSGSDPLPNVETDPARYALRNPAREPAVWIGPEDGTETDDDHRGRPGGLVASPTTADRLAFAPVDGVEAAREFVETTDFERETLLVEATPVGACYELEFCHVEWSTTRYHSYYARHYRPVDVACEADERHVVSSLVRIPEALDPEEVTGSGSGVSSGGCHSWERRLEASRERTTDDGNGSPGEGR